jgi:hypothetical protein
VGSRRPHRRLEALRRVDARSRRQALRRDRRRRRESDERPARRTDNYRPGRCSVIVAEVPFAKMWRRRPASSTAPRAGDQGSSGIRWRDPESQIKSQTKSQRPQTRGVTRLQPATIAAGKCHIRPHQATSRHGKNASYKRGVTGSNPVAPTRFLQLGDLIETLIGDPVTTAGNHRCMLPDGGRVPKGRGGIL